MWCNRYGLQSERSGVESSMETPLVFVRKSIRNLKCYVAPVQSRFERECVVVEKCTSEPAKLGKNDIKPTFFFFFYTVVS